MTQSRASAIVFADLRDALRELEATRGSPKDVRRAFSRFVDLTQRLTASMRTDFSRAGKGKWQASAFPGWNAVTEFFKWMRNQDQHELPIHISVHERRFQEVPGQVGRLFSFEGTWILADQLSDAPPQGITFYPADPVTGKQLSSAPPVKVEYQFLVQPRSEPARTRLHGIGTTDVHQLSAACFSVLSQYYDFFLAMIRD
ncbi:MAG: hypothetical protein ACREN6_13880 [Gemmatimonadaceae bacterium]